MLACVKLMFLTLEISRASNYVDLKLWIPNLLSHKLMAMCWAIELGLGRVSMLVAGYLVAMGYCVIWL